MNQGTKKERLEELEDAIRRVYASVMNEQAIEYRRKRHLLDVDEQMALLIQQVAGQAYGSFYFPAAAGMGCSYNPYKWMEYLNPEAGMLRMVAGLGDKTTANVKRYDEVKNFRMTGFLTFYFKGSDESEAEDRIQSILWEDQ